MSDRSALVATQLALWFALAVIVLLGISSQRGPTPTPSAPPTPTESAWEWPRPEYERGLLASRVTVEEEVGDPTPAPANASSTATAHLMEAPETSVLTHDEMRSVLATAGWPAAWREDALSVACGPGVLRDWEVRPQGESGCDKAALGAAGEIGLFQLMPGWAEWCGVDVQYLRLPLVNARCAWEIVEYEITTGLPAFAHWSVQPR